MANLDEFVLDWGVHSRPDDGICVMEAVSYLAGEPFGDHPDCAPRVVAAFLRRWNDDLDDADRQMLKPYVPRLVAAGAPGQDEAQAWLASDWLVRELAPAFLRAAGLAEHATELETLPEVTQTRQAEAASPKLSAARDAAADAAGAISPGAREDRSDAVRTAATAATWAVAWDAARAAGWAAAGSAIWAAVPDGTPRGGEPAWTDVGDAARIAAWDAARVAAWRAASAAAAAAPKDAAGDAAWAAARDAVRAALRPAVNRLQQSALTLLDRMLELRPNDG